MTEDDDVPQEYEQALELMAKAGWVKAYVRNKEGALAVDYTDGGKERIAAIRVVLQELGVESVNQRIWWAVRCHAVLRGPLTEPDS